MPSRYKATGQIFICCRFEEFLIGGENRSIEKLCNIKGLEIEWSPILIILFKNGDHFIMVEMGGR